MKAHNFSVGVGPANPLILWMEAEKERLFSGLEGHFQGQNCGFRE
jgi:hypothetical protein